MNNNKKKKYSKNCPLQPTATCKKRDMEYKRRVYVGGL